MARAKAIEALLPVSNSASLLATDDGVNRTESGHLVGESPRLDNFPLSFNQQSLLFMSSLDAKGTSNLAYNIPFAAEITSASTENIDVERLIRAMNMVLEKHDSLRTVFKTPTNEKEVRDEESPRNARCLVMSHAFSAETSHVDGSTWSKKELQEFFEEQLGTPFDLEKGPIIRMKVITNGMDFKTVLFLVVHHIAVDLWSFEVMMRDLGEAWAIAGKWKEGLRPVKLPPATWHYCTYVKEQKAFVQGIRGESQWNYWRQQLKEPLPVLSLPLDRARVANQSYFGSSHEFDIPNELGNRLRILAKRTGVTLFTLMLAAFNVLLHKYSDCQEDVIVGTPMACRNGVDSEKSVGYFVNPVPLRLNLSGNPSFEALVDRVKKIVVEAFDNQELPFSELVRRLELKGKDRSRSPLFDVMFILQKAHSRDLSGLEMFFLGKDKCCIDIGDANADR